MTTDRLTALLAEYAELEGRLADPAIHADQVAARRVGRRFAELSPIASYITSSGSLSSGSTKYPAIASDPRLAYTFQLRTFIL